MADRRKKDLRRTSPTPIEQSQQPPAGSVQQGSIFSSTQLELRAGPLPDPAILREYDELVPGAADRIISMAEQQSEHRRRLEAMVVRAGIRRAYAGATFGLILGMTSIGGGIYLAATGHDLTGFGLVITAVAGLAGVFIHSRYRGRQELVEKDPRRKPTSGR
jgi:uncharacterized membrane protein